MTIQKYSLSKMTPGTMVTNCAGEWVKASEYNELLEMYGDCAEECDRLRLILNIAGIDPDARPHEPDGY